MDDELRIEVLELIRRVLLHTREYNIVFFFFKQKTAYEIGVRLVGSEMCIRDRTTGVSNEGARESTQGDEGVCSPP